MSDLRTFVAWASASAVLFVVVCVLALIPLKAYAQSVGGTVSAMPGESRGLADFAGVVPSGQEFSYVVCTRFAVRPDPYAVLSDGCGTLTSAELPAVCEAGDFYVPPEYTEVLQADSCSFEVWVTPVVEPPPPDPGTTGADTVAALQGIGVILCFAVFVHGIGFGNRG